MLADKPTVHMTDPKPQEASIRTVGVVADKPTVHMTDPKPQEASVMTVGVPAELPTFRVKDTNLRYHLSKFDDCICRIHFFLFLLPYFGSLSGQNLRDILISTFPLHRCCLTAVQPTSFTRSKLKYRLVGRWCQARRP